ncbi:unnamed protein product [Rhodiola kirilowii]
MDHEIEKIQEERKQMEKKLASVQFDTDLYGASDTAGYLQELPVNEDDEVDTVESEVGRRMASYTAPKSLLKEMPRGVSDDGNGLEAAAYC